MAFEDLTENQQDLIRSLVDALISGKYRSDFVAITTFKKGWLVKLAEIGSEQEKRLEGIEESDLLALGEKGYINLKRTREGYLCSLQPKAYHQYKANVTPQAKQKTQNETAPQPDSFDSQQLRKIEKTSETILLELQKSYELTHSQANLWFRWSLGVATFGVVLLAVGIVLVFSEKTTPAIVNSVAGILIELVSILFFNQAKSANQRHDQYHTDLVKLHQILQSIQFVKLVSKTQDRDKLIEVIINQVLNPDTENGKLEEA